MNNSSAHYMHSSPRSFWTTSPSTQLVDVPRGDESFVSFASTENEQATNKDVTLTLQQIALPVLAVPTEGLHSEYSNLFQVRHQKSQRRFNSVSPILTLPSSCFN